MIWLIAAGSLWSQWNTIVVPQSWRNLRCIACILTFTGVRRLQFHKSAYLMVLARLSDRWKVKGGGWMEKVESQRKGSPCTHTGTCTGIHGVGLLAVNEAQLLSKHLHPSPAAVPLQMVSASQLKECQSVSGRDGRKRRVCSIWSWGSVGIKMLVSFFSSPFCLSHCWEKLVESLENGRF